MSKHFGWFDAWKTTPLTCARCGWTGTFEEGDVDHHESLIDSTCPKCDAADAPILAIVSLPTMDETEEHLSDLPPDEQEAFRGRKKFLADWQASSLVTPDQLQDIPGAGDIVLLWDFVEDGDASFTVITHGGVDIWREPALWEGYERFRAVVAILRQKYAPRLTDVVPHPRSLLYLGGDFLGTADHLAETRRLIREGPTSIP